MIIIECVIYFSGGGQTMFRFPDFVLSIYYFYFIYYLYKIHTDYCCTSSEKTYRHSLPQVDYRNSTSPVRS